MQSWTCWAQTPGSAVPTSALVLTNLLAQSSPGDALRFFRDSTRQATLSQVLAKPEADWSVFKPGSPRSFGFTDDIFWLRFRLKSALSESCEAVVELDNPRLEKVDWFVLRHGEVKERGLTGNGRSSSGPLPRPRLPDFRFKLDSREEVEVVARVESRSSIILSALVYSSPETKANEDTKHDWLVLAVSGFFLSLSCLGVVLGVIMRSRLQQINAVISFLLCSYFLLIDGSWARLGLPFAAELAMRPTLFLVSCMNFLVALFTSEFIPIQYKDQVPSRAVRAILGATSVEIALIPFLSYHNGFRLVVLMSIAVGGGATIVAWWLHRVHPGGGTRLLLGAWLINLAVVVNISLELLGVIPAWLPQTIAPLVYGLTISGLFLAASIERAQEFMREQVRASQLEKSLAEARLLALRYQVNPHFLFNALNTAVSLAQHEPVRVTPFLYRLATFLRAASNTDPILTVPLAEEVEKLSAYLDVEKVRFEERLEVTLDFPAELGHCQVPELILQPLVENAIKQGMSQSTKAHRIRLSAQSVGDHLQLEVANTGKLGESGAQGKDAQVSGLSILLERLELLYQDRGKLTLTEDKGWVIAHLSLPMTKLPANTETQAGDAQTNTAL